MKKIKIIRIEVEVEMVKGIINLIYLRKRHSSESTERDNKGKKYRKSKSPNRSIKHKYQRRSESSSDRSRRKKDKHMKAKSERKDTFLEKKNNFSGDSK